MRNRRNERTDREVCEAYGLGNVTVELQSVSGGLLHTMYRVETESGVYAVKVLNPEIMQRPTALRNMIHSEKVSHALENVVPLVAAKEFDGAHVMEIAGMEMSAEVRDVFDWEKLCQVMKCGEQEYASAFADFFPELLELDNLYY